MSTIDTLFMLEEHQPSPFYKNGNGNGHHKHTTDETALPFSIEAEQGLLGAALIDAETARELPTLINGVDDFYREGHRYIAQAILSLVEEGEIPDFISLPDRLEQMGKLEAAGSRTYLVDLMNACPSHTYARSYARIVQRTAKNRGRILFAQKVAQIAYRDMDEATADAEIETLYRKYMAPSATRDNRIVTWHQSLYKYYDLLEKRGATVQKQLEFWPFATFNKFLPNPPAGVVTTLTGDDGAGKTMVAEVIADHWSGELGMTGAIISMDMSREMMEDRRTCRHTSISLRKLATDNLTDEERTILNDVTDGLQGWPGQIHYVYMPGAHVDDVIRMIHYLHEAYGIHYVIVDNMRNLHDQTSPRQAFVRMNDNKRESDNIAQIAATIGKLNLHNLVINQLKKSGKEKSSPEEMSKNDLEGSANQTNVTRLQLQCWRGWAKEDEISVVGDKTIVHARKGDRSKYLYVRATKTTFAQEFTATLLMEPDLYRMSEVELNSDGLDHADEPYYEDAGAF